MLLVLLALVDELVTELVEFEDVELVVEGVELVVEFVD